MFYVDPEEGGWIGEGLRPLVPGRWLAMSQATNQKEQADLAAGVLQEVAR